MWGYWGWGGSTRHLVKAFDEAEAERGFEPLVFVDIRIKRQVRSVGFRGDAFERLIGPGRHEWMRKLGNSSILDHSGGIELEDPSAIGELLNLAITNHRRHRRVIFFCACKVPRWDGERKCHRDLVAELLVKEATRRGVALSVAEWPGGEPRCVTADFPSAAVKAFLGDALTVPMPKGMPPSTAVSLPWGSYAMVGPPDNQTAVALGPAVHSQGRWCLSLPIDVGGEALGLRALKSLVLSVRRAGGYEPRFAGVRRKRKTQALSH